MTFISLPGKMSNVNNFYDGRQYNLFSKKICLYVLIIDLR